LISKVHPEILVVASSFAIAEGTTRVSRFSISIDTMDLELERLVAGMSVTQIPAHRHNGGFWEMRGETSQEVRWTMTRLQLASLSRYIQMEMRMDGKYQKKST
jgi:hypothetical protein